MDISTHNKYDCVVVGAGIAGITASYYLGKAGKKVLLLDADGKPGGLLKSDEIDGEYYDYGTHLVSETGIAELDSFLFSHCTNEDYKITRLVQTGNYHNNYLNEKNCTVDIRTLDEELLNKAHYELLETTDAEEYESLERFYIERYGETIYEHVFHGIAMKYFGEEPRKIHYSAGKFFDMSHVLAYSEELTSTLGEITKYNKILSHHTRVDGIVKHYPKQGGLTTYINSLIEKITAVGVDIKLGAKINEVIIEKNNVKEVIVNNCNIPVEHFVWTLPPALLIHMSGIKNIPIMRPVFRKTTLFDFSFDKPLQSQCNFINVYQTDMISGRITLYQNMGADCKKGIYSCTVEVLSSDELENDSIDKVQSELQSIGIITSEHNCKSKGLRKITSGFPVLYKEFVEVNKSVNSEVSRTINNITISGKGAGKVFFMGDVLRDMYKQISLYLEQ